MYTCIEETDFRGKSCSVCGIGISNYPLIDFLLSRGAIVTARDRKEEAQLPCAEELRRKGVKFCCGEAYLDDIRDDYIFRAPGIRFDVPGFTEAVARGSILTSEMQLFFELCPCRIIGITGSDGKTTTTTLISEILKAAGYRVFVGGNIGRPLLPELGNMTENDYAVVELSSFQLQTMTLSPDIAVVTNISPNHLNYHGTMEEYVGAKENIFLHMRTGSRLVLNAKNSYTRDMASRAPEGTELLFFGDGGDVCERDGYITAGGERIVSCSDILLPGHHNIENYMAAVGALRGIANADSVHAVASTFTGVEHRCELVGERGGIRYYNSSIDSSPTRTIAALGNFAPRSIILICGGYDKHIPFEPLAAPICERVRAAVMTGATAEKIYGAVSAEAERRSERGEPVPELQICPDFDDAVRAAAALAHSGDVVLLSPACASFDAFPNFEVRGRCFKELVGQIIGGCGD